ncbi:PREDICTED: uncharacterized protein LOC109332474 [Lupinus angustifolius]|uniref:uncharacterized protein LOC109332474 n=1 Tax=Lupinus angustifolius TaxID=3871 RepID=UPI00092F050A|nr:PREDICTED: uncharacterized protein LOC109332474 [Lupinus angustifolius]
MMVREMEMIEDFRNLSLAVQVKPKSLTLGMLKVSNELLEQLKGLQSSELELQENRTLLAKGRAPEFQEGTDGVLRCKNRVCVPRDPDLKMVILDETHKSKLNRDPCFTSKLWNGLQTALGTKLSMRSAYHPQTDGQSERTIQSLEDLLRACGLEHSGSWADYLHLIEFTYNNSFCSNIGMTPYEAFCNRKCITSLCWFEAGENLILGPDVVQQTTKNIRMIRENMKTY